MGRSNLTVLVKTYKDEQALPASPWSSCHRCHCCGLGTRRGRESHRGPRQLSTGEEPRGGGQEEEEGEEGQEGQEGQEEGKEVQGKGKKVQEEQQKIKEEQGKRKKV